MKERQALKTLAHTPKLEYNQGMNYQAYFHRDPKTCGGETVLKGTRVTVRTVLASLAEGAEVLEILKDFPLPSLPQLA